MDASRSPVTTEGSAILPRLLSLLSGLRSPGPHPRPAKVRLPIPPSCSPVVLPRRASEE